MIIQTKLHIPRTNGNLIKRTRLFQQLEKGLNTKVTVITAPAGYGKSTLLSEWGKTIDKAIAWISLDENDNDPMRFWKHTIESLHQASAELAKQLEIHHEKELDVTDEATIAKLLNRLNRLSEKTVLIWDDFHYVDSITTLNYISYFLEHLPTSVNVYITSRTHPSLPLSRMRVEGSLNELTVKDLRLRKEEAEHFFQTCTDLFFSEDELAAIYHKTEGWIAGMRLLALSLNQLENENPNTLLDKISGEYYTISDYFFEEVFLKQSPLIQELLLKTSILDRIHVELVDILLGSKIGTSHFHQLESENLFLISLDHKRIWYRYHHLFQEFLQRKRIEIFPNESNRLYRIAGKWFEEKALYDEAIDYYLMGNEYDAALNLLADKAPTMIHSNLGAIRSWFDKIPDALLIGHPKIIMHDIFSLLMMGHVETAEEKLNHCLEIIEEPSVRSGLEMLRVMSALFANDLELFIHLSEEYVEKYPDADEFIGLGTEGDLQIPKWSFLETVGNMKEREQLIRRLLSCWSNSNYYYFVASLNGAYGELMYEWNRLEDAKKYFEAANRLGELHQNKLMIVSSNILLAKVYMAEGKIEKVEEIRRGLDLEVNREQYPLLHNFVQIYQTYFLLQLGKIDEALHWLENCGLQVTDEIPDTMLVEYNIFVALLAEKGDKDDAISLVIRLIKETRRMNRLTDYIRLLTQYSILLAEKGETTRSLDVLEEALSLAEKNHYKRTLTDVGKGLQPLLQFYLITRKKNHRQAVHQVSLTYVKELLGFYNTSIKIRANSSGERIADIYLTEKEMLVLRLLTTSLTNKEIAFELDISLSTAKTHINSIYGKLDASNRMEAIERAKLLNFI